LDDEGAGPVTTKPRAKAPLIDTNVDLRLLQSHRLSHVAETGQLTPRTRRVMPMSGDWSGIRHSKAISQELESDIKPENYFTRPRVTSLPLTASMIDPFERFRPAVPPPAATVTDSYEKSLPDQRQNTIHRKESLSHEVHAVATAEKLGQLFTLENSKFSVSQESIEIPEPAHPAQTFQHDRRNSHVVRKVNSSFEIMRPGTFDHQPAEPLSSLEIDAPDNRRYSQKLRKNRPSYGERRRSNFIDLVYGDEKSVY
jgi:hypothetical protein